MPPKKANEKRVTFEQPKVIVQRAADEEEKQPMAERLRDQAQQQQIQFVEDMVLEQLQEGETQSERPILTLNEFKAIYMEKYAGLQWIEIKSLVLPLFIGNTNLMEKCRDFVKRYRNSAEFKASPPPKMPDPRNACKREEKYGWKVISKCIKDMFAEEQEEVPADVETVRRLLMQEGIPREMLNLHSNNITMQVSGYLAEQKMLKEEEDRRQRPLEVELLKLRVQNKEYAERCAFFTSAYMRSLTNEGLQTKDAIIRKQEEELQELKEQQEIQRKYISDLDEKKRNAEEIIKELQLNKVIGDRFMTQLAADHAQLQQQHAELHQQQHRLELLQRVAKANEYVRSIQEHELFRLQQQLANRIATERTNVQYLIQHPELLGERLQMSYFDIYPYPHQIYMTAAHDEYVALIFNQYALERMERFMEVGTNEGEPFECECPWGVACFIDGKNAEIPTGGKFFYYTGCACPEKERKRFCILCAFDWLERDNQKCYQCHMVVSYPTEDEEIVEIIDSTPGKSMISRVPGQYVSDEVYWEFKRKTQRMMEDSLQIFNGTGAMGLHQNLIRAVDMQGRSYVPVFRQNQFGQQSYLGLQGLQEDAWGMSAYFPGGDNHQFLLEDSEEVEAEDEEEEEEGEQTGTAEFVQPSDAVVNAIGMFVDVLIQDSNEAQPSHEVPDQIDSWSQLDGEQEEKEEKEDAESQQ